MGVHGYPKFADKQYIQFADRGGGGQKIKKGVIYGSPTRVMRRRPFLRTLVHRLVDAAAEITASSHSLGAHFTSLRCMPPSLARPPSRSFPLTL